MAVGFWAKGTPLAFLLHGEMTWTGRNGAWTGEEATQPSPQDQPYLCTVPGPDAREVRHRVSGVCVTMSTLRENWRKKWLASIAELTSIDLQRASWLDAGDQNPHWSFIESMCFYFDDCACDDYLLHIKHGYLSPEEFEAIRAWHELLDHYNSPDGDDNSAKVLEDPDWLAVVSTGNVARQRLETYLNASEMEIIRKALIYPGPSKWP